MRKITLDITKEKGKFNRFFSRCVGAGRAAEVMRLGAYNQLKKVKTDCGFEYIRFHGLFHEEMAVVYRDKNGALKFNFQYIDMLFDSLLELGIRPVVELGLMPEIMAKEKAYVFWWKMNISPPQKIEEWHCLVKNTVEHFTERYGKDEVKKWYFEVWNEPNLKFFFTEPDNYDAYYQIYDAAAEAVKAVCPEYKVGGPVSGGVEMIDDFVEHCRNANVPFDFVSGHVYCSEVAFDDDGTKSKIVLPIDRLTDPLCEAGEKWHSEGIPFLVTEWSASSSSRDVIHDNYFSAPFVLDAIKRCENKLDMMSYWVYTDIFEEISPPVKPLHGGFGIMTVQSFPKPTYHAFRFLNSLSDTELLCDDSQAYACLEKDGASVLLWNLDYPDTSNTTNPGLFGKPFPAQKKENAKIIISGVCPDCVYKVTVETVGYNMGDCYTAFLEGGYSDCLTAKEEAELMKKSEPRLTEFEVESNIAGKLEFEIDQSTNQVDFLRIENGGKK